MNIIRSELTDWGQLGTEAAAQRLLLGPSVQRRTAASGPRGWYSPRPHLERHTVTTTTTCRWWTRASRSYHNTEYPFKSNVLLLILCREWVAHPFSIVSPSWPGSSPSCMCAAVPPAHHFSSLPISQGKGRAVLPLWTVPCKYNTIFMCVIWSTSWIPYINLHGK